MVVCLEIRMATGFQTMPFRNSSESPLSDETLVTVIVGHIFFQNALAKKDLKLACMHIEVRDEKILLPSSSEFPIYSGTNV